MNDEIKEILDKFDKVLENYELDKKWGQMSVDSICHLFPNEMIIIKDYITNLQKENERYKKIFESKERFSKIMPDDIDFIIMSKADYDRQVDNRELVTLELKSRNEKAIEYIKQYREVYYPDEPLSEPIIQYGLGIYEEDFDEEKLLNILQGEDKE